MNKTHQKLLDELNDKLYVSAYKSQFISSIMHPLTGFLGNVGFVAVCLVGGFEVIGGRMTIGNIQSFTTYVRRLNQPINSMAQLLNTVQTMVASAERIFELLNEEEEEKDTENPVQVLNKDNQPIIKGSVKFDHVRFGYNPEKIVIKDFSMDVEPGMNIAIVGPTGAGKTSLVQLIPRLYDASQGCVKVGGHDVRDYKLVNLRDAVAMVLQKNVLFSGTIESNIKFSNPEMSDEQI